MRKLNFILTVVLVVVLMFSATNGICGDIRTAENARELVKNFHVYFDTGDVRLSDVLCQKLKQIIPSSQTKANKIANVVYDPAHGVDGRVAWQAVQDMDFTFYDLEARIIDEKYIEIRGGLLSKIREPESGVWLDVESKDISGQYLMIVENDKLVFCVDE